MEEMEKMGKEKYEISEEDIENVTGGAFESAQAEAEKKGRVRMYCPKCRSDNTVCSRVETYHVGQTKVRFRVYSCRACKLEFRIPLEQTLSE